MSAVDAADPREQRALALKRLAQAQYELGCALGYLQNSDQGSRVLVDLVDIRDRVDGLQETLQWRQRRESTP